MKRKRSEEEFQGPYRVAPAVPYGRSFEPPLSTVRVAPPLPFYSSGEQVSPRRVAPSFAPSGQSLRDPSLSAPSMQPLRAPSTQPLRAPSLSAPSLPQPLRAPSMQPLRAASLQPAPTRQPEFGAGIAPTLSGSPVFQSIPSEFCLESKRDSSGSASLLEQGQRYVRSVTDKFKAKACVKPSEAKLKQIIESIEKAALAKGPSADEAKFLQESEAYKQITAEHKNFLQGASSFENFTLTDREDLLELQRVYVNAIRSQANKTREASQKIISALHQIIFDGLCKLDAKSDDILETMQQACRVSPDLADEMFYVFLQEIFSLESAMSIMRSAYRNLTAFSARIPGLAFPIDQTFAESTPADVAAFINQERNKVLKFEGSTSGSFWRLFKLSILWAALGVFSMVASHGTPMYHDVWTDTVVRDPLIVLPYRYTPIGNVDNSWLLNLLPSIKWNSAVDTSALQPSDYATQPAGYATQPAGYATQPAGYATQPAGYAQTYTQIEGEDMAPPINVEKLRAKRARVAERYRGETPNERRIAQYIEQSIQDERRGEAKRLQPEPLVVEQQRMNSVAGYRRLLNNEVKSPSPDCKLIQTTAMQMVNDLITSEARGLIKQLARQAAIRCSSEELSFIFDQFDWRDDFPESMTSSVYTR